MKARLWRLIPLLVFFILGAFLWRGLSLEPQKLPSVQLGRVLPAFQLERLDAEGFLTPDSMKGQVVLLNVWASWCAACTEEQVFLMKISREGIPLFGLNYKDKPEDARKWLGVWGNPFRAIGSDTLGRVAIDLGVYGAPETFVIDKRGVIRYRQVGIIDESHWQSIFAPLIKKLQDEA